MTVNEIALQLFERVKTALEQNARILEAAKAQRDLLRDVASATERAVAATQRLAVRLAKLEAKVEHMEKSAGDVHAMRGELTHVKTKLEDMDHTVREINRLVSSPIRVGAGALLVVDGGDQHRQAVSSPHSPALANPALLEGAN